MMRDSDASLRHPFCPPSLLFCKTVIHIASTFHIANGAAAIVPGSAFLPVAWLDPTNLGFTT